MDTNCALRKPMEDNWIAYRTMLRVSALPTYPKNKAASKLQPSIFHKLVTVSRLSRFAPNMALLSFCLASSDVTTTHSYGWMLKPDGARMVRANTWIQRDTDQQRVSKIYSIFDTVESILLCTVLHSQYVVSSEYIPGIVQARVHFDSWC